MIVSKTEIVSSMLKARFLRMRFVEDTNVDQSRTKKNVSRASTKDIEMPENRSKLEKERGRNSSQR